MPNTKSAIRRVKKTKLQSKVNKIRKSKYKSVLKQMSTYIAAKKMDEAKKFFPKFQSQLMKIAKTGIIKRQNASRNVSRITKRIASI